MSWLKNNFALYEVSIIQLKEFFNEYKIGGEQLDKFICKSEIAKNKKANKWDAKLFFIHIQRSFYGLFEKCIS